jgi:hypothetical protein
MDNVELTEQQVNEESRETNGEASISENKQQKHSKRLADVISNSRENARFEPFRPESDEVESSGEDEGEESEEGENEPPTEEEAKEESHEEDNGDNEDNPQPAMQSEALREAYPDEDLSDPGRVNEIIGELVGSKKDLKAEREANEKLYDLFENSPEMVSIVRRMDQGDDIITAIASTVQIPEAIEEMKENDPEKYKKFLKAQAQRENRQERAQEKQEEFEQEFQENQEASQSNIDQFKNDQNMDDQTAEKFLGEINDHFSNIVKGKVSMDFLNLMQKALNYEQDVEKAKEQGKVEGRNAKITAEKNKKKGDGLPNINSGSPKEHSSKASVGKKALASVVSGNKTTFS